jgi:hypothetical protein
MDLQPFSSPRAQGLIDEKLVNGVTVLRLVLPA